MNIDDRISLDAWMKNAILRVLERHAPPIIDRDKVQRLDDLPPLSLGILKSNELYEQLCKNENLRNHFPLVAEDELIKSFNRCKTRLRRSRAVVLHRNMWGHRDYDERDRAYQYAANAFHDWENALGDVETEAGEAAVSEEPDWDSRVHFLRDKYRLIKQWGPWKMAEMDRYPNDLEVLAFQGGSCVDAAAK